MDDGTDNEPHEETNLQTDDDSDEFDLHDWMLDNIDPDDSNPCSPQMSTLHSRYPTCFVMLF